MPLSTDGTAVRARVVRSADDAAVEKIVLPDAPVNPTPITVGSGSSHVSNQMVEYREARNAGYQAGFAAGLEAAAARVEQTVALLTGAAKMVSDQDVADAVTTSQLVMDLALELTTHIIGRELSVSGSFAEDAVRKALTSAARGEDVTVMLNPLDADLLPTIEGVEVLTDGSIRRGSAEAHVGSGFVDLGVDAAIERVRAAVRSNVELLSVSDMLDESSVNAVSVVALGETDPVTGDGA